MKINILQPTGDYNYSDEDRLPDYVLDVVEQSGAEEIWYWYWTAPYEGSGWLLARKGDKYDTADLGHCSCYGPEDLVEGLEYTMTLDQLKANHSQEAWDEIGLPF